MRNCFLDSQNIRLCSRCIRAFQKVYWEGFVSVHTRNAKFRTIFDLQQDYFAPPAKDVIQLNGALDPVHTVPDQFLQRSVSLYGTV